MTKIEHVEEFEENLLGKTKSASSTEKRRRVVSESDTDSNEEEEILQEENAFDNEPLEIELSTLGELIIVFYFSFTILRLP